MKRRLLRVNTVRFTEETLIIDKKTLNYRDIDMVLLRAPERNGKTYLPTHILTVFTTTDAPLNALIDLHKKESVKIIEEIKAHIKDRIIEYYDSEIIDS